MSPSSGPPGPHCWGLQGLIDQPLASFHPLPQAPHVGESGVEGRLPPLLATLRFALGSPIRQNIAACRRVALSPLPHSESGPLNSGVLRMCCDSVERDPPNRELGWPTTDTPPSSRGSEFSVTRGVQAHLEVILPAHRWKMPAGPRRLTWPTSKSLLHSSCPDLGLFTKYLFHARGRPKDFSCIDYFSLHRNLLCVGVTTALILQVRKLKFRDCKSLA